MNQMRMETCVKCGGARFYGSGTVGWSGPICNCAEPVPTNPPTPALQGRGFGESSMLARILEALERIEKRLERKE